MSKKASASSYHLPSSSFLYNALCTMYGEDVGESACEHIPTLSVILSILTLFQLVNFFSSDALHSLELRPRDFPVGFVGLLVSPLVEASFSLFFFNAMPFSMELLYILAKGGTHLGALISLIGAGCGGILTWIMARQDAHFCGTGPLIATYSFFLVFMGFFTENNREIVLGSASFVGFVVTDCMLSEDPRKICWEGITFCAILGAAFGYTTRGNYAGPSQVGWEKKVPDDLVCEDEEIEEDLEDDEAGANNL